MEVSVITPTWQRHRILLDRCIPSVAAQTMPVEHIVISDGPDPVLRELLEDTDVVYAELDAHPTDLINVGGWARNLGLDVASGDIVAYLDDDNAFRPQHIELLSTALQSSAKDFAYSQMFRHGLGDVIGSAPPAYGCIDSSIIAHWHETQLFGRWPAPSIYEIDWQLIGMWLAEGATWVHVPEVTVDYYYTPRRK